MFLVFKQKFWILRSSSTRFAVRDFSLLLNTWTFQVISQRITWKGSASHPYLTVWTVLWIFKYMWSCPGSHFFMCSRSSYSDEYAHVCSIVRLWWCCGTSRCFPTVAPRSGSLQSFWTCVSRWAVPFAGCVCQWWYSSGGGLLCMWCKWSTVGFVHPNDVLWWLV